MALLLEHAIRLEAVQIEADQPPLPVATAHDVAGDLWLQVHRYDDARRAYLEAETQLGARPRLSLGLARVAARLQDRPAACAAYARLAAAWGGRGEAPELAEAQTFLAACPQ